MDLTGRGPHHFLSSAAFSWSKWKQYLIGIYSLVFWKKFIIENSLPIPPYTQHHLLWMKTSLWCGWWWFISLAPRSHAFYIIEKYPLFSSPITICFKNRMFSLHLSRESYVDLFCSLVYFVHYIPLVSEIIWYLSFTKWLISLRIIVSSSIHAVTKGKNSFFLSAV